MQLSPQEFRSFYTDVVECFKDRHNDQGRRSITLSQVFKLNDKQSSVPNLNEELEKLAEELQIAEAFKEENISPRYLYDLKGRVERQRDTTINIKPIYAQLLLRLLGFSDLSEYRKARNDTYVRYTGFYWSYVDHEIKTYALRINYQITAPRKDIPLHDYDAEQQGFHDTQKERLYKGYAYLLEGNLQIIMMLGPRSDRLRMFLDSGDKPEKANVMRGLMVATSTSPGKPVMSTETVVVRDDSDPVSSDRLRIQRYLMLHRYNYRIRPTAINLKVMESKRVQVDLIRRFVGAWNAYRYDLYSNKIVSSILYVRENYKTSCFTQQFELDNLNEQVCLVNVTDDGELHARTICLDCYPKQGAQAVSTIMLEIPGRRKSEIEGVIVFVGHDGSPPRSRSLILCKNETLTSELLTVDSTNTNLLDKAIQTELEYKNNEGPPARIKKLLHEAERSNRPCLNAID